MKVEVRGQRVFVPLIQRGYDCVSAAQAGYLAGMIQETQDVAYAAGARNHPRWRFGALVRKGSAWVGVHYSEHNKRWCINLVPCITLWVTKPGGNAP